FLAALLCLNWSIVAQNNIVLFADDFSSGGPYPNANRWGMDSRDVYINNLLAGAAPSLGVATFDHFDENGQPYDLAIKQGDILTSVPIDLSTYGPQDQIILSFFFQARGIGDPANGTAFFVEFLDATNNWVEALELETIDNIFLGCEPSDYAFHTILIDDQAFLHPDFRMRFRVIHDDTELYDYLNLDYVKITAQPTHVRSTQDVAFSQLPTGLLDRYASMPWRHFYDLENNQLFPGELMTRFKVGVSNQFDFEKRISDTEMSIADGSTNLFSTFLLSGLQQNIPALSEEVFDNPFIAPFPDQLSNILINHFNGTEKEVTLTTTYRMEISNEESNPLELAQMVQANNQSQLNTHFGDYFAYDDGSPEHVVPDPNATHIMEFKANVDDVIAGIRIHVANSGHLEDIRLHAWKGVVDDDSDRIIDITDPMNISAYSGFSFYTFIDAETGLPNPLSIEAGETFYIGFSGQWVGYDLNNPEAAQYHFVKTPGGMAPFSHPTCAGAPMVRPVMGEEILSALDIDLQVLGTLDISGRNCEDNPIHLEFNISQNPACSPGDLPLEFELYEFNTNNTTLVFRQDDLMPSAPGQYRKIIRLNPLDAGMHDFRLVVSNDCGVGVLEFPLLVEPSIRMPLVKGVCNDEDSEQVESDTYWGVNIFSPSIDHCVDNRSAANVPSGHLVEYKGIESISLFPGFRAHSGADFLAAIEEVCFVIGSGFTEKPSEESAERQSEQERADLQSATNASIALKAYPNPFKEQLTIDFHLPTSEKVNISLYNLQGTQVATILNQAHYPAGHHQLSSYPLDLVAGIYLVELQTDDQRLFEKLIKLADRE
ncbi:MAG: T9SS type A sorting domain-containing protein, partial [Bacteroidota bacterium]